MRPIVSGIFLFGSPAIVDSIVLCRLASDREPGLSSSGMDAAVANPVPREPAFLRFAGIERSEVLLVELPSGGRIYIKPDCLWEV